MIKKIREKIITGITGFKSGLLMLITILFFVQIFFTTIIFAIGTFTQVNVNAMAFMDLIKASSPLVLGLYGTTFGLSLAKNFVPQKEEEVQEEVANQ